jgi:flagellar hook assembly protein FlgD/sugar lactone lactonase YvrE
LVVAALTLAVKAEVVSKPFTDKYKGITANFGQYRSRTVFYKWHDGMDFLVPVGTPIRSLFDGTITEAHDVNTPGWGKYLVVESNDRSLQYRYAHLSQIIVTSGRVSKGQVVALSGNTGGTRPHLHLSLGPSIYGNQAVNPVVAGMEQPKYGDATIAVDDLAPFSQAECIKILDRGKPTNYPKPNHPVQVLIEAYQALDAKSSSGVSYSSTPYKVVFEIEGLIGTRNKTIKTIQFDDLNHIWKEQSAQTRVEDVYAFQPNYMSMPFSAKDYYYMDWTPSQGLYRITVKVYSCYRDAAGFHLQNPPDTRERIVTVGMVGVDFPSDGAYANLFDPNTSNISVAAAGGGVRSAAVSASRVPNIYYTDVSNTYFSVHPNNPGFTNSTWISARADKSVNWQIKMFDEHNNPAGTLTATGATYEGEWRGGGEGVYYYQVEAKEPTTGLTAYRDGITSIQIDNTPPYLSVKSDPTVYIVTSEADALLSFSSNEDLYSAIVSIIDVTGSAEIENLATNPELKKDEVMSVTWGAPGFMPNGWYFFKITAIDRAGNQTVRNVPVQVNLPGQPAPPDSAPDPTVVRLVPPEEVKALVVGDIAFDNAGNKYVLYTNKMKMVRYDSAGKATGKIEGFTTSSGSVETLWYPLGLAVSPAGDRIYIADTYANRVLIYDGDLRFIRQIKGKEAYIVYGDVDSYSWILGLRNMDYSGAAGGGLKTVFGEGYSLPGGVATSGDKLYVVDRQKHRLLKYTVAGTPEIFSVLKADLKDEARAAFNQNFTINGQTVDRALFYSNALNDQIVFDRGSCGPNMWQASWERSWLKEMFWHSNPPGSANGQFDSPAAAIDKSGDIYLADTGNNRIQKFISDGSFVSKFGEGVLKSPKGVDVDSFGNIWVADAGNQRIVQLDSAGNMINEYKSEEYAIEPQKIKLREGRLYIADAKHDQPLVWNVGGALANVRVSSAWFSPVKGKTDPLEINYYLSQPADVTIQLLPKSGTGTPVTLLNKVTRSIGAIEEVWDGSGEAALPDGQYTLKVIASFGDYVKSQSLDLTLDSTPPVVNLDRAPPAFSPLRSGPDNALTIDYTIADNLAPTAEATLTLYKNNRPINVIMATDRPIKTTPTAFTDNWNGQIGSYVIEGHYVLELKAADLAGNTAVATQEVLVDVQPPRLENVKLSNNFFSPNGDSRKDNTEISFYLADNYAAKIPVTILVEDKEGKEAATIIKRQLLEPGYCCFTWEGSALSDGEYKLRVYAEDDAGNLGTCEPQAVAIDTVPPTIESFAAAPNPFTPNNDGTKDRTLFSYRLSEPAAATTVIEQGDGTRFRKYLQDLNPTGKTTVTGSWEWDGRGSRYELLGGNLNYYLLAEDQAGNIATSETSAILVDCQPSLVPYLFAEPDPFSPPNPRNGQTRLSYALARDNVRVDLTVIGQDGAVLKRLIKGEIQTKGGHQVAWDGSYDPDYAGPKSSRNGSKISDGTYEFRITATDLDGGEPADITNTVVVDSVEPNILTYLVNINYEERRAALKYVLPETASVEAVAYDLDGLPVQVLVNNEEQGAGEHWAIFRQPNPEYQRPTYIKVSAIDRAQNSAEQITDRFSVVPLENLQITAALASPDPFTPNSDGLMDLTRITYQLSGGAPDYRVSLDIQNETGSTVRHLLTNDPQGEGNYSFYWDGKNDSGQAVPDGHYRYLVSVEDKLGVGSEGRGTLLLVSTKPAVNLAVGPVIFSPNGDGAKDTIDFNYGLNYATLYISSEGLVKLEVLNASGEAFWSKTLNKTAGSYVYTYDGLTDAGTPLPAGNYFARITGQDALGTTAVPQAVPFNVDYTNPEPTDFSLSHAYAKLGDTVTVNLSFPEPVAEDPSVTFLLSNGIIRPASLVSKEADNYTYQYLVVGADSEGITTIEVVARDLAFNPINKTKTLTIDQTEPAISELTVVPNPASTPEVSGPAAIQFKISEPLRSAPRLWVAQSGAAPQLIPVTGQWTVADGLCTAQYKAFAGNDGLANITIEVSDLANNPATYRAGELLTIDTVAPLFSRLECLPKFVKAGAVANIRFQSSEPLKVNPDVSVNGNPAIYDSLTAGEYSYNYPVSSSDWSGTAEVRVAGRDFAGNEGLRLSSSPESLVIDLVEPTVGISTEPGMIANPGHFATNASAAETALQTTLQYNLSEPGYVTTRVYKMDNTRAAVDYTRSDFTAANLITTLENNIFKEPGAGYVIWNGSVGAGNYAAPGKYAFLVEVRDRAGNLTQRLWGGTVWIQNNALKVQEPDQTVRGGTNPNPHYFSPKNNPGDPAFGAAKYWFKVLLGVTPKSYEEPERIEVMGLDDDIAWLDGVGKKGGYYTVTVHDQAGQLVRTVESGEFVTSANYYAAWNGKDDAGQYVPDGKYYFRVDVRDYLGRRALDNLMTREVVVDNTAPVVVDNQTGDEAWRNAGGTTYNVGFRDDGADASRLALAQYRVRKADGTGSGWSGIPIVTGEAQFTAPWAIDFANQCTDGTNQVYVKVQDIAGNLTETADPVFYIKKDVTKPTNCILEINNEAGQTNTIAIDLTKLQADDPVSGVAAVIVRNDSDGWSGELSPGPRPWILKNNEGGQTVSAQFRDNAGNWSDPVSKTIIFRTMPTIGNLSVSNGSFNPYLAANTTSISFNAADAPAGLQSVTARLKRGATVIREWPLGTGGSYAFSWDGTNSYGDYVNEGDYTLEIEASDNAGNRSVDSSRTIAIWDDINISNNSADSFSPAVLADGDYLNIRWTEGAPDDGYVRTADASASCGWSVDQTVRGASSPFYIDHDQTVTVRCRADGENAEGHAIYTSNGMSISGGTQIWSKAGGTGDGETVDTVNLSVGWYYADVTVKFVFGQGSGYTKVDYIDRKYNQYQRISQDGGKNWNNAGKWPDKVDGPPGQTTMTQGKTFTHSVDIRAGEVWYRRLQGDSAWEVKLTRSGVAAKPSLTINGNQEDCLVVWEDNRSGNKDIYFQKIPHNFAPVSGNPTSRLQTAAVRMDKVISQAASLESPALITPADNSQNVTSLRPTFEWRHHQGETTAYRLDVAKNDTFTVAAQTFTKAPSAGTADKADLALFNYTYAIHEFDPGLDRDTYYWKVTALTTNEAATSEVWSFTITPELTLTGVTNFPNPFNPNREKTKIRYRLGADADSVKIRIYSITGALVAELDGSTNGESANIWDKYNDIEWDGRNGRGELVMNGIYPFEISARLGDKSLTGRGKIAVLK